MVEFAISRNQRDLLILIPHPLSQLKNMDLLFLVTGILEWRLINESTNFTKKFSMKEWNIKQVRSLSMKSCITFLHSILQTSAIRASIFFKIIPIRMIQPTRIIIDITLVRKSVFQFVQIEYTWKIIRKKTANLNGNVKDLMIITFSLCTLVYDVRV